MIESVRDAVSATPPASILICPDCKSSLTYDKNNLVCSNCRHIFDVRPDGVVNLLPHDLPEEYSHEIKVWHDFWTGESVRGKPWALFFRKGESFHKLEFEILPKLEKVGVKGTVLEVGSGMGFVGSSFKATFPDVTYYSTDIAEDALRYGKWMRNAYGSGPDYYVACSIDKLPFANESFDIVLGSACLHHLLDLRSGLRQIHRILRKNGVYVGFGEGFGGAFSGIGQRWLPREKHEKTHGVHEGLPRYEEWIESFKDSGFVVESVALEREWYYKESHVWMNNEHYIILVLYYAITRPLPDWMMKRMGAGITFLLRKT